MPLRMKMQLPLPMSFPLPLLRRKLLFLLPVQPPLPMLQQNLRMKNRSLPVKKLPLLHKVPYSLTFCSSVNPPCSESLSAVSCFTALRELCRKPAEGYTESLRKLVRFFNVSAPAAKKKVGFLTPESWIFYDSGLSLLLEIAGMQTVVVVPLPSVLSMVMPYCGP